ncbi:MAG: HIRAN domain-containing protein [Bacteroidota bacterium]
MIFKPGLHIKLTKDPENPHDSEAVKVELDPVGQVGYVANSVHTVPKGCCSAGRIYDSFAESIQGLVRFVTKDTAIVELEG